MSAPLPVVECGITPPSRFGIPELEIAENDWPAHVVPVHEIIGTDLPAVALPWALLEDPWFHEAVQQRFNEMTADLPQPVSDAEWDAETGRLFAALAAELRERAGRVG